MSSNQDGWGIMWAEDGRVKTVKKRDMKAFWDTYQQLDGKEIAIHFRMRTHGATDDSQAHPYPILDKERFGMDLWLMHNGVISVQEVDKTKSDTWHWIEQYIRPILEDDVTYYKNPEFWEFVKSDTWGSRLLFMDDTGLITKTGVWNTFEGAHYSNTYWRYDANPLGWGNWDGYPGRGSYYYGSGSNLKRIPFAGSDDGDNVVDLVDEAKGYCEALTVPDLVDMTFGQLREAIYANPDDVAEILWDLLHNS